MRERLNYYTVAPAAIKAMRDLSAVAFDGSGLEQSLLELVKIRSSQINRCAFCIHMHTREARAMGETEERLYMLNAWRESSLYTQRERAALAWTEALTDIIHNGAADADYDLMQAQFAPAEQVKLTLAITTINAWNRIAVGFRSQHPAGDVHAAA